MFSLCSSTGYPPPTPPPARTRTGYALLRPPQPGPRPVTPHPHCAARPSRQEMQQTGYGLGGTLLVFSRRTFSYWLFFDDVNMG